MTRFAVIYKHPELGDKWYAVAFGSQRTTPNPYNALRWYNWFINRSGYSVRVLAIDYP